MLQRVAVRDDLSFRKVVTDWCLQFNYLIKTKLYRWFKSNKESQKEKQVKKTCFFFLPFSLSALPHNLWQSAAAAAVNLRRSWAPMAKYFAIGSFCIARTYPYIISYKNWKTVQSAKTYHNRVLVKFLLKNIIFKFE